MVKITGSIMQAYTICQRQAWLLSHQITSDQQHMLLELGRLIDEESYYSEKRELRLGRLKVDIFYRKDSQLLIGEIKKSSKSIESAKMQIGFYLLMLENKGVQATGELLFPRERKKVKIELDSRLKREIVRVIKEATNIISLENPPRPRRIKYCKNCAYFEFCWS